MTTYLYESLDKPYLLAVTIDATGSNLPVEHGPWQQSGNGTMIPIGNIAITAAISEKGYFLIIEQPRSANVESHNL